MSFATSGAAVHRVLIVEDDSALNELLTAWLGAEGYVCSCAGDGAEAIAVFDRERPDAALLDLSLPRIHGFEVLRALRERSPGVVVLVMSGFGGEQSMELALRFGADDFLPKPVRREALLAHLKRCLETAERDRIATLEEPWSQGLAPEELGELFVGAPAPLVCADPEGRIVAINGAASRLVGRRADELLGRPVEELVVEEIRPQWPHVLRQQLRNARRYEGEILLKGPAGKRLPAAVVAEREPGGRLIFSLRDLTAQKRMEEKLYESRKLASLGKVVEGVAHEVRNPLISIGGFARKLRGRIDATETQYLDVILSEVRRLEKMVSDIEEYVAFTQQRRPRFAQLGVADLLRDLLPELRSEGEPLGARVHFEATTAVPQIFGDPDLLRVLFRGLVQNAFDAMPSGGDLSIRVEGSEAWVHVRVEDTGVGIPAESLGEVFDPFVTSKTTGAGLGLAKAYMIVEEHAGTIEFESQVGKGTVCTVSLPIDRRRVPRIAA